MVQFDWYLCLWKISPYLNIAGFDSAKELFEKVKRNYDGYHEHIIMLIFYIISTIIYYFPLQAKWWFVIVRFRHVFK